MFSNASSSVKPRALIAAGIAATSVSTFCRYSGVNSPVSSDEACATICARSISATSRHCFACSGLVR